MNQCRTSVQIKKILSNSLVNQIEFNVKLIMTARDLLGRHNKKIIRMLTLRAGKVEAKL